MFKIKIELKFCSIFAANLLSGYVRRLC